MLKADVLLVMKDASCDVCSADNMLLKLFKDLFIILHRNDLSALFMPTLFDCLLRWFSTVQIFSLIPPPSLHRRYPTQRPELGCYGHTEYSRGVRNYGKRDPSELFDVYCFANEMHGEFTKGHFHMGLLNIFMTNVRSLKGRIVRIFQNVFALNK